MPTPEINVRLTADGVQDVVNAFKRVQQEAKATKEHVSLLGQASEQLGELLPVITIGAAVTEIVELGKSAMDTAVNLGRMAEKTGASVGTLSVLAEAAHDVNVEQDQLGGALTKLARSQDEASQGSAKQTRAFKTLGISMQDIRKLDPAGMFVLIAKKLQDVPPGAQRAATAMALFGRSGAEVIPLLDKIGKNNGFEEAEADAKKLGTYLSEDMVAQAIAGQKALKDLQNVTEGIAMRFMAGFGPQLTGTVENFTETVSGSGQDAMQKLGDMTGNVFRGIVATIKDAAWLTLNIFSTLVDSVWMGLKTLTSATLEITSGNWRGALDALKGGWNEYSGREKKWWSEFGSQTYRDFTEQAKKPTLEKDNKKPTGASGDGSDEAAKAKALKEHQKLVDARATYEESVAAGELQKQKALDAQREAQDKESYAAGLETLKQYYDARAARINAEADAERAIMQKKLDAEEAAAADLMGKSKQYIDQLVQQGPKAVEAAAGTNTAALQMLQKVAATRAQMDTDAINRETKLQQNETERHNAEAQAVQKIADDRIRLYQLEGNTAAARQASLERELQQTDELLRKLGISEEQRNAILTRSRVTGTARNNVQTLSEQGQGQLASLSTEMSAIQTAAASGAISQLDAEKQITAVEMRRLPVLQSIASQMQEAVNLAEDQLRNLRPGTDEYNAQANAVANLQRQVDQYTQQIYTLAAGLRNATTLSVELSNLFQMQGIPAMVGFFDSISSGTKSASEAFADLGKEFEAMISHMISRMIVYYTLMLLVGWIAPNSSLLSSLKASGPFGGLLGHKEGGYTGDTATNKVAGVVHGREFVFSAPATKKWGLPLLEAMNAGVSGVATSSGTASLGGATSAGGGSPLVELNIDTGGQPATTTQRTGPGGKSIIDVVVGEVASNIAGGGKVGQAIQSTFGVTRKGIVRG